MRDATGAATSIGDTARIVALYRALESERHGALFHDPHARRLAGSRGERLVRAIGSAELATAVVAQRTVVFDEIILRAVTDGHVDAVLNLAAGLDARAYRLPLPARLRWIDVDVPEIVADRHALLEGAGAACRVETVALDLGDGPARLGWFGQVDREHTRVLVVTEGLLLYLAPPEVASLADDLAAQSSFSLWLTDLMSPMAARQMRRAIGGVLTEAALQFAPASGTVFFRSHGWASVEVRLALAEARRLGRPIQLPRLLSLALRLAGPLQRRSGLALDGTALLTRRGGG